MRSVITIVAVLACPIGMCLIGMMLMHRSKKSHERNGGGV